MGTSTRNPTCRWLLAFLKACLSKKRLATRLGSLLWDRNSLIETENVAVPVLALLLNQFSCVPVTPSIKLSEWLCIDIVFVHSLLQVHGSQILDSANFSIRFGFLARHRFLFGFYGFFLLWLALLVLIEQTSRCEAPQIVPLVIC